MPILKKIWKQAEKEAESFSEYWEASEEAKKDFIMMIYQSIMVR